MKTDAAVTKRVGKRDTKYVVKSRIKKLSISLGRALLLFGLCFMIIQPLIIRFSTSLMVESDLYDSTIVLLPRNVTLDNYRIVAELTDLKNVGGSWHFNALLNPLWVSVVSSLFQIVSTTLVAYGFARYNVPLKKFWFALVIALIIIPPQTIQSALYMNFANFDVLRIFTLHAIGADVSACAIQFMSSTRHVFTHSASRLPSTTRLRHASICTT